ncbi:MAG: site-specific DNA-methyltransferase [Desulfobacteraceae bacterium]|nr:site-specific DNA-methyltransferase [Desulfobacteraceae bacterium]
MKKPLEELLDSVRDIEGFPIGKDEDILALSDPPYYTACPNPYINDFIEEHGKLYDEETDDYHREPFVGDVSEGKNDPIYNAHSYHTKVPHKAIMKYIEHYTDAGDIVLDGFCGTGMTGVAAQLLNRKAVLSDLSPIATFIAYNYNNPVDADEFEKEAKRILKKVEEECGWMYETRHVEPDEDIPEGLKKIKEQQDKKGKINYTVWSDVFICPYCSEEYVFSDTAVDQGKVLKEYACLHCSADLKKTDCKRATVTFYDTAIQQEVTHAKQVPVLINYTCNKKRYEKKPDKYDFELIKKINESDIPYWFPVNKMMDIGEKWGDTWRAGIHFGITHVHHFYTKRSLWTISKVYQLLWSLDARIRSMIIFTFEQAILGMSKIARYVPTHYSQVNQYLSGTLYIGSQIVEVSLEYVISGKIKRLPKMLKIFSKSDILNNNIISAQSMIDYSNFEKNTIDYIFTDPPFGDNLMYSELNCFWEIWLKIITHNKSEAIINKTQNKSLTEYHQLMLSAFKEYYRVLKPKRWITVVFHNSKSAVWNAIQEAMTKAGFIIAHVTVLDKKQGSFKQVTAAGAVKNDLVISAYKPKQSFETQFIANAGQGLEEKFIKMHLNQLPTEPTIERTEQMLYSKLLAYYIQRGYAIKYDAAEFYKMLRQNFTEEDGYWFNTNQIASYIEYKQKMKLDEIGEIKTGQLLLFVNDEKSAIVWLNAFLNKPKDFQTVHPAYTKISNISGDNVPDIKELLDKNFILENGKYRRPKSEDEKLSVTQKRERELQREFDELLLEAKGSKKKIKECRKQAVIFGFEQCYKNSRFQDILDIGRKLDKKIVENDSEISDFIEVAELKVDGF